jgi:hypothetical protein
MFITLITSARHLSLSFGRMHMCNTGTLEESLGPLLQKRSYLRLKTVVHSSIFSADIQF